MSSLIVGVVCAGIAIDALTGATPDATFNENDCVNVGSSIPVCLRMASYVNPGVV